MAQAIDQLNDAQVKFARILWCDNANVIRGKAVHRSRLEAYLKHGVGISTAQQALPVMADVPVSGGGLGPVGEVRLVPDPQTLTMLPYAPGYVQFMGDMVRDGSPWPCCPRHFLRCMIAEAAAADLTIMAAFENEFYLLQPSMDWIVPADRTVFAATLAMELHREVIGAISDALTAQGITVEQYYPESGPGQQELSMGYTQALQAADQQVLFRETVRSVAGQHQRRASFVPKLFPDQAGSGCHLHLSLWRKGKNLVPDADHPGQLSLVARRFMAGILAHLPALMALTTPSVNSYRRIRPHCWSGAFRCWGFDNREAAIRVPTFPEPPSPAQLELKTVDASANPYLALGAVIAAGLDGVRQDLPLAEPVQVDPGNIHESERRALGIDPLHQSLGAAIADLEKDWVLLKALGSDLAAAYLAVRRTEWETMKGWDLDREVELLVDRY
jgi:glutamine synthetase